jgi:pilus assembly protein Flp/PilA
MLAVSKTFNDLMVDEGGASAVEYGLLVAGIAAVIVIIVFTLGGIVKASFQKVCTALNNNTACSPS